VLSIRVRSHSAAVFLSTAVFGLAAAACWFNSLDWLLSTLMTLAVGGVAMCHWRERRRATKVTRLNLSASSCTIQVDEEWLPAELIVHFCGGSLLILKLRCLDGSSPTFGQVFWAWFYPGVITELEQRQLRCLLANEYNP
jgi:hypothetical protein